MREWLLNTSCALSAGTDYHLHTTPSGSTKGGRNEQAVLREYQANRKDRDGKPEFLDHIRAYLISEIGAGGHGTAHLDQEADDGMATAGWQAYLNGRDDAKLCVIASKDKDLRMVPGFQLIGDEVRAELNSFGSIELDRSKSSPKVIGRGTSFFWAQLLMGDTADNISGLPKIVGRRVAEVKPTKAYTAAIKAYGTGTDAEDARHLKTIDAVINKPKSCGAVITYEILKDVGNDRDAYSCVRELYREYAERVGPFVHWSTGVEVTYTQALLSEMMLLWMRRNKNPKDVVAWLKENVV